MLQIIIECSALNLFITRIMHGLPNVNVTFTQCARSPLPAPPTLLATPTLLAPPLQTSCCWMAASATGPPAPRAPPAGQPPQLEHEQLFADVTKLIHDYLLRYRQRSSKVPHPLPRPQPRPLSFARLPAALSSSPPCSWPQVVDFKRPDELRRLIDLPLQQEGIPPEALLELVRKAMEYSVHTGIYAGAVQHTLPSPPFTLPVAPPAA